MKNHINIYERLRMWLFIIVVTILQSCGTSKIAPGIIGTWKSDIHKITVRSEPERMKFQFFSDSTFTSITIREDKTVIGKIGSALIENGRIKSKWLLPAGMTGIAYTITCNLNGKIFENDPLDAKEVEFWIGPNFENDDWELRYTTGGSQFPMAFIYFNKEDTSFKD